MQFEMQNGMKTKLSTSLKILIMILVSFSLSHEAFAKKKRRHRRSTQAAENFEEGLCIQKNEKKTQASGGKNSYCDMLRSIVDDPKSCAHQAISQLVGGSSSSVNGLGQFCSAYSSIDSGTDFYYQLLSVMAYTESRWNPKAVGDHGNSKGFFQLTESDAANYSDCKGLNSKNIFDPYTNMKCGACIAMSLLAKDNEMGSGRAGTRQARGMARYFGPFGSQAGVVRTSISNATNQFCNGNAKDDMQYASLGGSAGGGGRSYASTGGRVRMAEANIGHASH